MTVSINGQIISLPSTIITVADLAKSKSIPAKGTAIAINGRVIKSENWAVTHLDENDSIMIISAAYGG